MVCATGLHKSASGGFSPDDFPKKAVCAQAAPGSSASLRIARGLTINDNVRFIFARCQGLIFSFFLSGVMSTLDWHPQLRFWHDYPLAVFLGLPPSLPLALEAALLALLLDCPPN